MINFLKYKEHSLGHRYITMEHISPLLEKLKLHFKIVSLGYSVLNTPIYGISVGNGSKKILTWSQMHGNESTSTKALFDLLNAFAYSQDNSIKRILETCTLMVVPILNPDGAKLYQRFNSYGVDLNRDAKSLSQPESVILRNLFNEFKPDFCFNMHGQRTIFSAGNTNKPATLSFLAPAQDKARSLTCTRKKAMELIAIINSQLQPSIPEQIGLYDDTFNDNCVGDMFQSLGVPTLLFEAGHYFNDYSRDIVRDYLHQAVWGALKYIATSDVTGKNYISYQSIPKNEKLFFDVLIKQAKLSNTSNEMVDIGILFEEQLKNSTVIFLPKVAQIKNLNGFYGHQEFYAEGQLLTCINNSTIRNGDIIDTVKINGKPIVIREF